MNAVLISAVLVTVQIVVGRFAIVVAARAVVRRVGGLFVRGRAFLLSMLYTVSCQYAVKVQRRGEAQSYHESVILLVGHRDSVSVFDY